MALKILPTSLTAGETINKTITVDGYAPADGWSLSYRFAAPTPFAVAGVATEDATGWTIAVASAETLTWRRGTLTFDAIVSKGSEVVAVDAGAIAVAASPLLASQYQAALAAVEAAIKEYGTTSNRSFSMADMSVTYRDLGDLLNLRAFYIREIRRETTGGLPHIIRTRFNI